MVAAIIVLYHQSVEEVVLRISKWLDEIDYALLIDNTEGLPEGKKVVSKQMDYCAFGENRGIAFALNYGIEECIKRGFHWVLTMDQDSSFVTSLKPYKGLISSSKTDKIGLLYPLYKIDGVLVRNPEKRVLQSGSLVNVDYWKLVGGYEERYFIDYVDYDYCARLLGIGCLIQNVPEIILSHRPGNKAYRIMWGGVKLHYVSIAPIRYYYMARNGLDYILCRKDWHQAVPYLKAVAKILLQESPKKNRFHYFLRGVVDFFRNQWGKYK